MSKVLSQEEVTRLLRGIDPDIEKAEQLAARPPEPDDLTGLDADTWLSIMVNQTPEFQALAIWTLEFGVVIDIFEMLYPVQVFELIQAMFLTPDDQYTLNTAGRSMLRKRGFFPLEGKDPDPSLFFPLLSYIGCHRPGMESTKRFIGQAPRELRERIQGNGFLELGYPELVKVPKGYQAPADVPLPDLIYQIEPADIVWHRFSSDSYFSNGMTWIGGFEIAKVSEGYLVRSASSIQYPGEESRDRRDPAFLTSSAEEIWSAINNGDDAKVLDFILDFDEELAEALLRVARQDG